MSDDIILRTKDGKDISTNSIILRRASQFFDDMFTLPLSGQNEPIAVQEDSESWEAFISWIDPAKSPAIGGQDWIDKMQPVVSMADKYVCDALRHTLVSYIQLSIPHADTDHSLKVWILAVRLHDQPLAVSVARKASMVPMKRMHSFDGFGAVPISAREALAEYREKLRSIPWQTLVDHGRASAVYCQASSEWKEPWSDRSKREKHDAEICPRSKIGGSQSVSYLDWFLEYCLALQEELRRNHRADLAVVHRVGKCRKILKKASLCEGCTEGLDHEVGAFNKRIGNVIEIKLDAVPYLISHCPLDSELTRLCF